MNGIYIYVHRHIYNVDHSSHCPKTLSLHSSWPLDPLISSWLLHKHTQTGLSVDFQTPPLTQYLARTYWSLQQPMHRPLEPPASSPGLRVLQYLACKASYPTHQLVWLDIRQRSHTDPPPTHMHTLQSPRLLAHGPCDEWPDPDCWHPDPQTDTCMESRVPPPGKVPKVQ